MKVAIFTLSVFFIGLIFQILIWRFYVPKRYHFFIFIHYFVLLFISLSIVFLGNLLGVISFNLSFIQLTHIIIFYILILYPYLSYFTGVQVKSPTLSIVEFINFSDGNGRRREEFNTIISNSEFIDNRIKDLELGGYVKMKDNNFYITNKGKMFLYPFQLIYKILKIEDKNE